MNRFLKQHFRRYVPDGLRKAMMRRVRSKLTDPVERAVKIEETATSIHCLLDNRWSFLVPASLKQELLYYTDSVEGRAELYTIANAASAGGLLFDVGAHSGIISALFCAAAPQNKVVSFEPSPVLLERLFAVRELNALGDRMRIEQVAIGESSGKMSMLLDPAGGFVQVQRFEHTMWSAPQSIEVRIETLADAAARLGALPQFVKLDIESYEYEAIRGSREFLSTRKPTLFLELHLNYLEERNLSPRAVVDLLEECGYELYTGGGSRLTAKQVYDSPLPTIHLVAH